MLEIIIHFFAPFLLLQQPAVNPLTDLGKFFTDLAGQIVAFTPRLILALILLFVGWIAGKIVARIVRKILTAINIDKFTDKIKEVDLFSSFDFKLSDIASKLMYWMVFLIFFLAATETLGLKSVTEGISNFIGYIPQIVTAILFFVIGTLFANLIKTVIQAACDSMGIAAGKIISSFVFYFIVIMVGITALNQAGLDTQIITQNVTLAMGSIMLAFAIGYGFASKDVMANVLASFYSKNKFTIGQKICFENVEGTIVKTDSTSVTLQNGDKKIIVPLSKLTNNTVEIW